MRHGLVVLALAGAAGLRAQPPAATRDPLNRSAIDTTCAPCRDFFRYANGGWLRQAKIPPAYSMWGSFNEAVDRTDSLLQRIVEDARADSAAPAGSNLQKLGLFYGSCMDSAAVEAAGLAPLAERLGQIAGARTRADLVRVIGLLHRGGSGAPFGFYAAQDPKHSADMIATLRQGGLGLPNRDYYTRTDSASRALRTAYTAHVARMLALAGATAADGARDADSIVALETQLALASMTPVEQRDDEATYHKMSVAALQALTPDFDWRSYLDALGAPPVTTINVQQPAFVQAVDRLLGTVPVPVWQAYLRWHVLRRAAPALSAAWVNEDFRFQGMLTGTTAMLPRARRCLQLTSAALGEPLGEAYIRRAFTPQAKARVEALVRNLESVLHDRIEHLTWMSAPTKRQALEKLTRLTKHLGYPDRWRDYSGLALTRGPFVTNLLRATAFERARNLHKIGHPVDRSEWEAPPQTVDAFADTPLNTITFPAGILQPPWFDPQADDAVNYGGIGTVIGHEMTHLFDDEGRKYDADGNLRDWWAPADAADYRRRAERVVEQFNTYTVVDSATHVNGRLTLGENIADLGGVTIAYAALERALAGKPRPLIDGYTPEQRFFLAFAHLWRVVARPEYLKMQVNTDPHPPWMWRVNGPLSNIPAFAQAFACHAGDPMVRPEAIRAAIW